MTTHHPSGEDSGEATGAGDGLRRTPREPARLFDVGTVLTLGWIISSPATVGGAIGSGLESSEQVRAAAYGYHPTPDGRHDEQE